MASTGYLALWAAGQSVVAQREITARATAAGMAAVVSEVVVPTQSLGSSENRRRFVRVLRALDAHVDVAGYEIFGKNGELVFGRAADDGGEPGALPGLVGVLQGAGPMLQYHRRPRDGRTLLSALAPIVAGSRIVGAARVVVLAPEPLAEVIARSGWALAALAIADGLLVVGLGFFVLTRMVVRPLQRIQVATDRVAAGDWDQHIDPSGAREMSALATAFNQMTGSLASQREQLIRSEKLASVGQLAAGVAHEIGNPLAAVLGYVDILRADLAAPPPGDLTPEERKDTLDRVKRETQRIHRIIQDLLSYSRPVPATADAEGVDPYGVLKSAEALLRPQVRFRNVSVVIAPGPAEVEAAGAAGGAPPTNHPGWPRVLVAPGRLAQVLVNLLLNAADAMSGAGKVTVSCELAGDQVRLLVSDEGPGLPDDLRRKIFDPFFTTKPPGQGTGLGLPISRSILESYGGTLEITPSPPGKGATFILTLPAA